MATLASDDFDRADGGLGANWTTTTGETAPEIIGGEATVTTPSVSGARYTSVTWPNNQWAETVIGSAVETASDEGPGPAVRIASGAQTHYFAQCNTVETRLYRVVGGSFTQIGTDGPGVTTGDTIRLEVNGTTLQLFKNNSNICSTPITDANIASGDAGIWCTAGGAPEGTIASWNAGDFSGGFSALVQTGLQKRSWRPRPFAPGNVR